MSKVRRKVTVEKGSSVSETSEKRKPSVFERLGPGASRRYRDEEDAPSEKDERPCHKWMNTGSCSYGSNCRYSHPPLHHRRDDSPEDLRHKMKHRKGRSHDRQRSESLSPERRRSPEPRKSRRDKDLLAKDSGKIRSTVVVKTSSQSTDSESEIDRGLVGSGEFNERMLDFEQELTLMKRRQELQRELSQLQEEERSEDRENVRINIHKPGKILKEVLPVFLESSSSSENSDIDRKQKGKSKDKKKHAKMPTAELSPKKKAKDKKKMKTVASPPPVAIPKIRRRSPSVEKVKPAKRHSSNESLLRDPFKKHKEKAKYQTLPKQESPELVRSKHSASPDRKQKKLSLLSPKKSKSRTLSLSPEPKKAKKKSIIAPKEKDPYEPKQRKFREEKTVEKPKDKGSRTVDKHRDDGRVDKYAKGVAAPKKKDDGYFDDGERLRSSDRARVIEPSPPRDVRGSKARDLHPQDHYRRKRQDDAESGHDRSRTKGDWQKPAPPPKRKYESSSSDSDSDSDSSDDSSSESEYESPKKSRSKILEVKGRTTSKHGSQGSKDQERWPEPADHREFDDRTRYSHDKRHAGDDRQHRARSPDPRDVSFDKNRLDERQKDRRSLQKEDKNFDRTKGHRKPPVSPEEFHGRRGREYDDRDQRRKSSRSPGRHDRSLESDVPLGKKERREERGRHRSPERPESGRDKYRQSPDRQSYHSSDDRTRVDDRSRGGDDRTSRGDRGFERRDERYREDRGKKERSMERNDRLDQGKERMERGGERLDRGGDRGPDRLDRGGDRMERGERMDRNDRLERGSERDRGRDRSLERGRDRDRHMELSGELGMEPSGDRILERAGDRSMDRGGDRSMDRGRDRSLERGDRGFERGDRELDRGGTRSMDRGQDRSLERGADRSMDRGSDRNMDRSADRNLERSADRSIDRNRDARDDEQSRGRDRSMDRRDDERTREPRGRDRNVDNRDKDDERRGSDRTRDNRDPRDPIRPPVGDPRDRPPVGDPRDRPNEPRQDRRGSPSRDFDRGRRNGQSPVSWNEREMFNRDQRKRSDDPRQRRGSSPVLSARELLERERREGLEMELQRGLPGNPPDGGWPFPPPRELMGGRGGRFMPDDRFGKPAPEFPPEEDMPPMDDFSGPPMRGGRGRMPMGRFPHFRGSDRGRRGGWDPPEGRGFRRRDDMDPEERRFGDDRWNRERFGEFPGRGLPMPPEMMGRPPPDWEDRRPGDRFDDRRPGLRPDDRMRGDDRRMLPDRFDDRGPPMMESPDSHFQDRRKRPHDGDRSSSPAFKRKRDGSPADSMKSGRSDRNKPPRDDLRESEQGKPLDEETKFKTDRYMAELSKRKRSQSPPDDRERAPEERERKRHRPDSKGTGSESHHGSGAFSDWSDDPDEILNKEERNKQREKDGEEPKRGRHYRSSSLSSVGSRHSKQDKKDKIVEPASPGIPAGEGDRPAEPEKNGDIRKERENGPTNGDAGAIGDDDEKGVDLEYDPISDDELDELIANEDGSGEQGEDGSRTKNTAIVDALDIDWSSLVKDTRPKPPVSTSALKRFSPANVLARIGVSRAYAGEALMEKLKQRCQAMIEEEAKQMALENGEGDTETGVKAESVDQSADKEEQNNDKPTKPALNVPKFEFYNDIAFKHATEVTKRKERANLLSNLGPYRRALCARRDLSIRRRLCKVEKAQDQPPIYNVQIDRDLVKLSAQLLKQAKQTSYKELMGTPITDIVQPTEPLR